MLYKKILEYNILYQNLDPNINNSKEKLLKE
jgi:hypothetical protein